MSKLRIEPELRSPPAGRAPDPLATGITVCAVVVTYNRPRLLQRCVTALLAQERPPDAILVVDNASDEPAERVLDAIEDPRLHFRRFSSNTGGAGGFHTGLRWAFERGHQAAWLMDDDGTPAPDCLRELLAARARSGIHLLNPLVVDEDRLEKLPFGLELRGPLGKLRIHTVAEAERAMAGDGLIRGTVNPFNGTLIDASAYRRLGDIKAECFIWGDETEYAERALAREVAVATVVAARHHHPENRARILGLGPLGALRLCPADRSHHHYRNLGYIYGRYRTRPFRLAKFLTYVAALAPGSPREAVKFCRYFADGASDRYALPPSRADLLERLAP